MLDEFTNGQSIFTTIDKAFNSNMKTAYRETDLNALLVKVYCKDEKAGWKSKGSRFKIVIEKILHLDVDFLKLKLTRGSSYIPLPKNFSGKRSVIKPSHWRWWRVLQVGCYCCNPPWWDWKRSSKNI